MYENKHWLEIHGFGANADFDAISKFGTNTTLGAIPRFGANITFGAISKFWHQSPALNTLAIHDLYLYAWLLSCFLVQPNRKFNKFLHIMLDTKKYA